MVTTDDFARAVGLIEGSTDVLITAHTRPDGDACGSVRAMCDLLESLGKKVRPMFLSPLPQWYEFLFAGKVPVLGNDITTGQLNGGLFDDCDLVIIIDTNSYVQLPQFDEWIRNTHKKVLVIDHHVTTDNLGDVELIDTTAAAAGEIVLDLFKYAGWPITGEIAEALFVALSTDSGWFKFSNADSRVFRNAAELIECFRISGSTSTAGSPYSISCDPISMTPVRRDATRKTSSTNVSVSDRLRSRCCLWSFPTVVFDVHCGARAAWTFAASPRNSAAAGTRWPQE